MKTKFTKRGGGHLMQHLLFESDEFHEKVKLVLTTIEPLQTQLTMIETCALVQYVAGMLLAQAGAVLPEIPLHVNLTALSEGFNIGVRMYQREDEPR